MLTRDELLKGFQALERESINYLVVGHLAKCLHGLPELRERLEILIGNDMGVDRVSAILEPVWTDGELVRVEGSGIVLRYLPTATSLYVDLVFVNGLPASGEDVVLGGITVRVARLAEADQLAGVGSPWIREGFTLPERWTAVQQLAAQFAMPTAWPRGVRKYRSIEAAEADRESRDNERVRVARVQRSRHH